MSADVRRARKWATAFATRFPELLEAYLVGSRASGTAADDSDYDVVLVTQGNGALSVSNFDTIPSGEDAWGWLLPEDAAALGFAPVRCDVMLVDGDRLDAAEDVLADAEPHVLLWSRARTVRTQVRTSFRKGAD